MIFVKKLNSPAEKQRCEHFSLSNMDTGIVIYVS